MPTCCQGATCACKMSAEEGGHIVVSGSGQANDPFLLSTALELAVLDNTTFDLTLNGTGGDDDPWVLTVNYAATAKLRDLPDVSDAGPTNGQVLAFDTGTGLWGPAAPTTAAAGAVQHNTSLTGDGSVGTPLGVVADAARLLQSASTGIGLSDTGMVAVVRHFADSTARTAMAPGPQVNSLSMLATTPGEVDFWDGVKWAPILDRINLIAGSEFLQLSGPYNGLTPITRIMNQVSTTTDGSGKFTVISSTTLTGRAGVLTMSFQETGNIAWQAVMNPVSGEVIGTAYNLVDGSPLVSQPVTGMYDAYLY